LEQCLRFDPLDGYAWLVLSDAYKAIMKYGDCVNALDRALEHAPESRRWYVEFRMASVLVEQGRLQDAEQWFASACTADEANRHRWTFILRASNLLHLGEYARAENLLRQAVLIEGDTDELDELDEAHHTLGQALMLQGKYEAAEEEFKRAAALEPSSAPTQMALKALQGVDRAIEIAGELELRRQ
jgi:tetratricopeptide (TPR) repeat protein